VIGRVGTIFGEHEISILSIFQKGVEGKGARIVILTHDVKNSKMDAALAELQKCDFLQKLESCIRIFNPVQNNGPN
jgi:homoserine dehydrogenase